MNFLMQWIMSWKKGPTKRCDTFVERRNTTNPNIPYDRRKNKKVK